MDFFLSQVSSGWTDYGIEWCYLDWLYSAHLRSLSTLFDDIRYDPIEGIWQAPREMKGAVIQTW